MTSSDSVVLSLGGGDSREVTMVAFAKAFEMLGSWSFYRKTPMGTMAWLEQSLANSSVISFFPHKICKYSRSSKSFSNVQSS
jgi:hypothetical protein